MNNNTENIENIENGKTNYPPFITRRSFVTDMLWIFAGGALGLKNGFTQSTGPLDPSLDIYNLLEPLEFDNELRLVSNSDLLEARSLIDTIEKLGINHPLAANFFAIKDGVSTADGLIDRFNLLSPLIDKYGANVSLTPGDNKQNYIGGWALLESGLKPDIAANKKSKEYNAVGVFQYIPDTWDREYKKAKKLYPDLINDRKNPVSNIIVTTHNYQDSRAQVGNRYGFDLWAHHAGINRFIREGDGYLNVYRELTGKNTMSALTRYNEILPWELVDLLMNLKDRSIIYVGQIIAAQNVYNTLKFNPQEIQDRNRYFHDLQHTNTKGAGIDDILYPFNASNVQFQVENQDPLLTELLMFMSDVVEQNLEFADVASLSERYNKKLAVSAILVGKGTKIKIPFVNSDDLRTSSTNKALKYKRITYLLEIARIRGLISFASEMLPGGEFVYHVGLMPHVTVNDINHFKSMKNRNRQQELVAIP